MYPFVLARHILHIVQTKSLLLHYSYIQIQILLLYQYILTPPLTFTLSCAPWARSRVAISTDPLEAALCRGVSPSYYQV